MNIPPISRDLIEFLEAAYPNRIPSRTDLSVRDIGFLQGQLHVVDHFRAIYSMQQEDSADVLLQAQNSKG